MKIRKIEKNVPIPTIKPHRIFPVHKLNVGDSFFVESIQPIALRVYMHNSLAQWSRRNGRRFKMMVFEATVKKDSGVRIWRTK